MKVKVGNDIYKVSFKHVRPNHNHYKMITLCNIWKYDPVIWGESIEGTDSKDWLNMNYGNAKCGKHDNFCKETGRKIALTRALTYPTQLDKEVRTAIWNAYFMRDNIGIRQANKQVQKTLEMLDGMERRQRLMDYGHE